MAELMIVVAVITVLSAVSFVGVRGYQESMRRLEAENYAKEIYVAAQNHLTMANSQGRLSAKMDSVSGSSPERVEAARQALGEADGTARYFVVSAGTYPRDVGGSRVLDMMLPVGSLDNNVRQAGSYVIRYDPKSATVLDVFWSADDTVYGETSSYDNYQALLGTVYTGGNYRTGDPVEDPDAVLKAYCKTNGLSAIGYYGGVKLAALETGVNLKMPTIEVINAEKLMVKAANPNAAEQGACLQLQIKGVTSGNTVTIDLVYSDPVFGDTIHYSDDPGGLSEEKKKAFTVVLDDVTSADTEEHFAKRFTTGVSEADKRLIPGEDVVISAKAYNSQKLSNIAYSSEVQTNSLFASVTSEAPVTARVANFRHFENLLAAVSGVGDDALLDTHMQPVVPAQVYQVGDMDWQQFTKTMGGDDPDIHIYFYSSDAAKTLKNCLLPVDLSSVTYTGWNDHPTDDFGAVLAPRAEVRLASNIQVNVDGNAGLFGTVTGSTVRCVVATTDDSGSTVTSVSGSAGGLIGSASGSTVEYCGASCLVRGSTCAGGLIGSISGSTVNGCCSGGRTVAGGTTLSAYSTDSYNVTASGAAGGLIGSDSATNVTNSYSTCSASATGASGAAGGLIGSHSGTVNVQGCYATGAVSGASYGALAGTTGVIYSDASYLSAVNGPLVLADTVKTDSKDTIHTQPDNVSAFDAGTAAYKAMAVARRTAEPYLNALKGLNVKGGKPTYDFRTVKDLDPSAPPGTEVHYGDWPVPDVFVVNVPDT